MKRAFSLFELIVVVVIIAIISSFIFSKINDSMNYSRKAQIKSEIALVRNSISKINSKNILLKNDFLDSLDEAEINENKSELFTKILDFPLISTTKEMKKLGAWIKTSDTKYMVFINEDLNIEFNFEDNSFTCKSDISLCTEYE